MKTILSLALLLSLSVLPLAGAELQPSKYLQGQVGRDVGNALQRARKAGMPVVVFIYDASNKRMNGAETENEYCLRCFSDLPETKRLLSTYFVQVLAPWNARGVAELRDVADATGHPVAIFIGRDGSIIARHNCHANPRDALKRVQAIIAALK